jgi:hypothetical protein
MTSGASAINSAAYLRMTSASPPPQRVSIRTLRPSVQPNCCSACMNAPIWASKSASFATWLIRTPMRRTRSGCCASTATGHVAAAPPTSAMNSRRFTRASHPRLTGSGYQMISRGALGAIAASQRGTWREVSCGSRGGMQAGSPTRQKFLRYRTYSRQ